MRSDRKITHIVAIDEAHLFQTNPLPQMLAEGRKFGIAMILAHQYCNQLSPEVRDSLNANSANFSAFRLSLQDSSDAIHKLGDNTLLDDLCRIDAFNALTTISVNGKQTAAFTLQIPKPRYSRKREITKDYIESLSKEFLVEPYRDLRPLTSKEVMQILENKYKEITPKYIKDMHEILVRTDEILLEYADEESRRRLFIVLLVPLIVVLIILTMFVYMLASPVESLSMYFDNEEEYSIVRSFKSDNDCLVQGYLNLSFSGIYPLPFDHDGVSKAIFRFL